MKTFSSRGEITVFENSALLRITLFTLRQAFFSVLVALAIGLPGAFFLGSRKPRKLLRTITAIPFVMPSILVVLGFVLFFGNAGWLNRFIALFPGSFQLRLLYKPLTIILAHGFFNFPLVIRLVGDGISRVRKAYGAAAFALGASPFTSVLTLILPLSVPAVMAASLLVFLYSFTSFAVVLVLGGSPASTTLPVEIYRHARIFLNYHNAGALAIVETLIAVSVFLTYIFFGQKTRNITAGTEERVFEEKARFRFKPLPLRLFTVFYGVFVSFFILGPIFAVPLESLLDRYSRSAAQVFSLRWWSSLGESCLPALLRSLILAFFSATLSSLLAISLAISVKVLTEDEIGKKGSKEKNRSGKNKLAGIFRFFATAPIVSSGIVLGLGWLIFYGARFSRSPWAIVVLHSVSALPFAFNSVSEGFRSMPDDTLNAAKLCGAGPLWALLTTALPLSLTQLRSAWGIAAALSLGELNAVMMLGLEGWETLPLYIYRAAGAYRYGAACAAGTLLILTSGACLLLSEWRHGKNGA